MMRDDVIRKRMKAQMPSPAPLFTGRVRQTLDRLPERKSFSLFRYLPAAAMAVVAVAVIGLAVASRMNPGGMGNWFQALAGGEETATTEVTPAPTPEEQQTAEETALETVIPTETPMGTVEVTDAPKPTPEPEATEETPELTAAAPIDTASSEGRSIFGNKTTLMEIQAGSGTTTYVLKVEATDRLKEYYSTLTPDQNGMAAIKPYWEESDKPPMLIFLICSGVDKREGVERDRMALTISACKDNTKHGIYVREIAASIKIADDGTGFLLYLTNSNPNYQPTSNFTIITCSTYFETGTGLEYYGVECS